MYGELVKLKIIGFKKEESSEADKTEEFEVQVNPSQFKSSYKIAYANGGITGQVEDEARFKLVKPQELDLEFVIDGTGVISNDLNIAQGMLGTAEAMAETFSEKQASKYVTEKVDLLKKVMYDYEGEVHRPPFVKVVWGTDLFEGVLTSLDITYTLFQPDGTPLRAKVKASFRKQVPQQRQPQRRQETSPDLTHVRTVNDRDSISLMTYRIYDDPKYYLEVARANGLTNFRSLKTGNKLIFPPFEKTE